MYSANTTFFLLFALLAACEVQIPIDASKDGTGSTDSPSTTEAECPPEGTVLCVPGEEVCDNTDNDCDGLVDEGFEKNLYLLDCDGDGFARVVDEDYYLTDAGIDIGEDTVQYVCPGAPLPDPYRVGTCLWTAQYGDCDDSYVAAFPGRAGGDDCDGDGVDNDCDGEIDEDGYGMVYVDGDEDGHGRSDIGISACLAAPPDKFVADLIDCDDGDTEIHGAHVEVCGDAEDNNCNGFTDEGC